MLLKIEENKDSFFIFVLLVFLEHDQLDSYINEMVILNEDEMGNRPTYYCGVCHHQGNAKQDIERHIESSHIQTNPFFCPTCGSSHKTRRTLKIHQRSHKNMQLWYILIFNWNRLFDSRILWISFNLLLFLFQFGIPLIANL